MYGSICVCVLPVCVSVCGMCSVSAARLRTARTAVPA